MSLWIRPKSLPGLACTCASAAVPCKITGSSEPGACNGRESATCTDVQHEDYFPPYCP